MKPKNKLQKRVEEIRHKIPKLTAAQKKFGYSLTDYIGKHLRKSLYCLECGYAHRNFTDTACKTHKCESCKKTLVIDRNPGYSHQYRDFNVITVHEEFQVLRIFDVTKLSGRKSKPNYWIQESMQIWLREDYKAVFVHGYSIGMYGNFYNNGFSKFSIRPINLTALIATSGSFYPQMQWHPWFVKRLPKNFDSIKTHLFDDFKDTRKYGLTFTRFFYHYGTNYICEVLLKNKQIEAFRRILVNNKPHWIPQMRICIRHKYVVKDIRMWEDIISMLETLGMDTRNPKYICPKDFKGMHDHLSDLVKAKRLKDKTEREKEDIRLFHERMAKYRELIIKDKDIVIKPLLNIKDVYQEGETMAHCIFSNGYYTRKNLALFTSFVKDKPAESIVIDEDDFRIKEVRGYKNEETRYHKRILNALENNRSLLINTVKSFQS